MLKAGFLLFTGLLLGMTIQSSFAFPVAITYFDGEWDGVSNSVTLEFGTGSEVDHAAFHVWRSSSNVPPDDVSPNNAQRLTHGPILAENACSAAPGSEYIYLDTTVSATQDVYYYYLESIACSSAEPEFYGSGKIPDSGLAVVNPNVPPDKRLYMPLLHGEAP